MGNHPNNLASNNSTSTNFQQNKIVHSLNQSGKKKTTNTFTDGTDSVSIEINNLQYKYSSSIEHNEKPNENHEKVKTSKRRESIIAQFHDSDNEQIQQSKRCRTYSNQTENILTLLMKQSASAECDRLCLLELQSFLKDVCEYKFNHDLKQELTQICSHHCNKIRNEHNTKAYALFQNFMKIFEAILDKTTKREINQKKQLAEKLMLTQNTLNQAHLKIEEISETLHFQTQLVKQQRSIHEKKTLEYQEKINSLREEIKKLALKYRTLQNKYQLLKDKIYECSSPTLKAQVRKQSEDSQDNDPSDINLFQNRSFSNNLPNNFSLSSPQSQITWSLNIQQNLNIP